jgi:hypothetical protein
LWRKFALIRIYLQEDSPAPVNEFWVQYRLVDGDQSHNNAWVTHQGVSTAPFDQKQVRVCGF